MKKKLFSKKPISIFVVVLNALLLLSVLWCYNRYTEAYKERLRDENIGNVSNLNNSAIINSTALFDSWNIKLTDIKQYVEDHALGLEETLDYIYGSNSEKTRSFQLVGSDYTGFLAEKDAQGSFIPLDYTSHSYQPILHSIFDNSGQSFSGIRFATEFTDAGPTGVKYFAVYQYLKIRGETKPFTLMLGTNSKNVIKILNAQPDYDGQVTILIDSKGNFIVNNKFFTSTNLFNYLRERNGLSMAERNALQDRVQTSGSGELYYQKLNGTALEDYIFRYEKMDGLSSSDWYCVTCVPISSFKAPDFNAFYIIGIIGLLLVMIIIDTLSLNAMNRRLRESMIREKNASLAKGNFLSRMSHEIRTPLNAVIGYNTIACKELTAGSNDGQRRQVEAKALSCLEKSDIASKHLLTIINDVLDMSAIESGKIQIAHERFDFRGLITSLTTVFYSQARSKEIEFNVLLRSLTQEWVIGDQMRTNQILTNLLSNSIKFTPSGGSVSLIISQVESDSHTSRLHFEITDTGIGMTEEYLSHIWTPFEQADSSISRRFGGTGLGLTITKNLVDLMNGSISVKSKPDFGTTFDVELTFESDLSPDSVNGNADFSMLRALIVNGDAGSRKYCRLLFESCGVRCTCVASGADAESTVLLALQNKDPYTLCLIDWKMPQMDGIETIRRVRAAAGDNPPVDVLVAYDYTEVAEHTDTSGINRFLSKPIFRSSLMDLLVDIIGTRTKKPESGKSQNDFGGAHILLAEDNAMNMEIACTLLESAGLVVDKAWNGREAVDRFEGSGRGEYRAILMDIHMPELNGLEATRIIRSSSHPDARTIPIIAMTADAFAENVAEALAAGMNDHIPKPIDIPLLFETLHKYIS